VYRIVLLTEEALGADDAAYLQGLRTDDEQVAYHVLVPADTERNLLVSVLAGLSMGELRETVENVRAGGETPVRRARTEAAEALASSQRALTGVGMTTTGEVVADDPVPALREAVNRLQADEVQVVTRPHLVEDAFRRDWASRARRELGVPVLHIYAHSGGWMA
jgi:hypothetical protein